jgi:hypothetical protein
MYFSECESFVIVTETAIFVCYDISGWTGFLAFWVAVFRFPLHLLVRVEKCPIPHWEVCTTASCSLQVVIGKLSRHWYEVSQMCRFEKRNFKYSDTSANEWPC